MSVRKGEVTKGGKRIPGKFNEWRSPGSDNGPGVRERNRLLRNRQTSRGADI